MRLAPGRGMSLRVSLPVLLLACCAPGLFTAEAGDAYPGMISVTRVYASDDAGPGTQGLRIGYGYFGARKNDYPWGEFWAAFRESGNHEVTGAGLCVAPSAFLHRRLGLGLLVDIGLSERRIDGRSSIAGLIGTGAEGVVRLSRRWDLVSAVELVYHTTSDIELQARAGIRFHHEKLPRIRRDHD